MISDDYREGKHIGISSKSEENQEWPSVFEMIPPTEGKVSAYILSIFDVLLR